MEQFTDAELMAIIVALDLARQMVKQTARVQVPDIFDTIEEKIRPVLQVDDAAFDDLMVAAIGELRWVN
jgi:hypothetical protein